jgi:hypothetical protein
MFADAVKLTSCGVPAAKHGNKNKKTIPIFCLL